MAYHKIDWKIISDRFKRVKDCAEEWGISPRRVQIYCAEGRIEKAFKYGQMWLFQEMLKNHLKRKEIK